MGAQGLGGGARGRWGSLPRTFQRRLPESLCAMRRHPNDPERGARQKTSFRRSTAKGTAMLQACCGKTSTGVTGGRGRTRQRSRLLLREGARAARRAEAACRERARCGGRGEAGADLPPLDLGPLGEDGQEVRRNPALEAHPRRGVPARQEVRQPVAVAAGAGGGPLFRSRPEAFGATDKLLRRCRGEERQGKATTQGRRGCEA